MNAEYESGFHSGMIAGSLVGLIQGTLGSVCNYSAEALKDRMRFIQAVLEGDGVGQKKYGLLCFKEQREQHPEIFGQ
jgi:hypothetical protein